MQPAAIFGEVLSRSKSHDVRWPPATTSIKLIGNQAQTSCIGSRCQSSLRLGPQWWIPSQAMMDMLQNGRWLCVCQGNVAVHAAHVKPARKQWPGIHNRSRVEALSWGVREIVFVTREHLHVDCWTEFEGRLHQVHQPHCRSRNASLGRLVQPNPTSAGETCTWRGQLKTP